MIAIHLVMPMAGRGSRFGKAGFDLPKPLLVLAGQPFFWWAAQSVCRSVEIRSMTFVVLAEHIQRHGIDMAIRDRYADARLVVLDEPTSGALVTAVAGCRALPGDGPVVVNDCDHAFDGTAMAETISRPRTWTSGFLCHFRSRDPAYSYAAYDAEGRLLRTVEKQPISDLAIAGAYGFRDRDAFLEHAIQYEQECPYAEPFMSGVYNTIVAGGGHVAGCLLDRHISFGTPEEFQRAQDDMNAFRAWLPEKASDR